jgi:FAD/FMN-containing dehydrogenase
VAKSVSTRACHTAGAAAGWPLTACAWQPGKLLAKVCVDHPRALQRSAQELSGLARNGPDFANKRVDTASASRALIWAATGAASKLLGASG